MENIIQLRSIRKAYGNQVVLGNINLDIEKGSMVAIVGESGCGKTTLLNIIGLLEKFDSGKIKITNQVFSAGSLMYRTPLLRHTLSYLFQNFALMDNETVSINLDIALKYVGKSKREKEDIKLNALEEIGLPGFLNKKVYQLSGGEQQRIAIARAMIKPSEIILADEPTGSLDDKNKGRIIDFLKLLNDKGKTIIIVTHDSVVANSCSRIIEMK